jgi:hypothetical protein
MVMPQASPVEASGTGMVLRDETVYEKDVRDAVAVEMEEEWE